MTTDDLRGRRLGGFELIEPLGEGSFGSVWRARQVRLDREVAVKVLDPGVARDPTAARRFEREGRAAASLDHPAIVPVYEAGDDDGLYYLAMRLVDGETLADAIGRESPMPPERVVALLAPIAAGLDAAHAAGLIHRDVKPANVLIEAGRPYLGDFGIAASARELGRYTTGSIGTAEYMSPEQARGDTLDHRSDLYALGCVAFHAITGVSPFARADVMSTLLAQTTDDPPSTGHRGLDRFFEHALAKDPTARYDSGSELVAALAEAVSSTDAVAGEPAGAGVRSPRRRWLVAAATVAVLAVVAVAVVLATGGSEGGDADPDGPTTPTAVVADSSPATDAAGEQAATTEPNVAPTEPAVESTEPGATTEPPGSTTSAVVGDVVRQGGSVAVGTSLVLDDPNPHTNLDVAKVLAGWVLPVMYRIDDQLDAIPSLATGPPAADADDPLALSWTIRDDVVWNDGTPVTTADIVATHEYLTAPDTNAQNTLLYEPVVAVEAVDATTLRIRLGEPTGAAHLMYSTIHPIIQAAAWDAHRAGGGTAGTFLAEGVDFAAGPYQLATRQNPGELALTRNPTWDDGDPPPLDRVVVASYPDSDSLVEAQALGQVDAIWVDDVERSEILDARALPDTEVIVDDSDRAVQLVFNVRSAALADERVRAAVLHAIDREEIADIVVGPKTNSIVEPWNSLVFAPGQDGDEQPFADTYDVARANQLLDEAGWMRPDETVFRRRDGVDLAMTIVLDADSDGINTAVALEAALQAVGIDITGTPASAEFAAQLRAAGDFDLLLQPRVFSNDPVATAFSFGSAGCPATVPGCSGDGVNFGAFGDAEVDAALVAAEEIVDPAERQAAYAEIDRLLRDRVAAVPLYVEPAFTAARDDLVGVTMAPGLGPIVSLQDWGFRAES